MKSATKLWAVVDQDDAVMYSRGGSSTGKKLLIYTSSKKAAACLNNAWIKQAIPDVSKVAIKCIYDVAWSAK